MTIHFEMRDKIAILAADNPPVNALGVDIRHGLSKALRHACEAGAEAIVIYGKGRTWFAGADIREFGKPPMPPSLPDLCLEIEACPIPVIAAMHGTILGGGLEIALSCHYRVADPKSRLGLPEVGLGILPGAGGTQRLPRLAGYKRAVAMITSGKPISAQDALQAGILDTIENATPLEMGCDYAKTLLAQGAKPRPVGAMPAPEAIDFQAIKVQLQQKTRGQLSPLFALDAVQASSRMTFQEGLAEERRLFLELMETDQRKGLIHAFFAERQVSKLPELAGIASREIYKIGVIGGGTMGAGIATSALLAGFTLHLIEMSDDACAAAKGRIAKNLGGALKRGKITQEAHDHMLEAALQLSTDYADLSQCDLIIEAVFESMDVKREVFTKLDHVAKPGAILASNTSYLDLDEIADCVERPGDVIGLHFFSPAHVMRLLEIVVGDKTAPDVVATGFALGKALGKVSVRSGVCDGFIGNRILSTYRNAADHMVLDGTSPFEIDRVLEAFGFAMGPYAVADLAGLDIGWANRKRRAATRDPRERVAHYPDKLCEAGHFGQKTGKGYYIYQDGAKTPNAEVLHLIEAERAALGITPRALSDAEILRRYMAAMVNEAAKVVDEGIARRPLDVDMVLLMGYGFPRYHGGPMKWADMQGIAALHTDIEAFAKEDPYFWQVAPLLTKMARDGTHFEDINKGA